MRAALVLVRGFCACARNLQMLAMLPVAIVFAVEESLSHKINSPLLTGVNL